MINKLTLSGLVLLFSAIMAAPKAIAQTETEVDTGQSDVEMTDDMNDMSSYDVRRTEAFNLVSAAYRGDFEDQGINGYNVLITEYEAGNVTGEDVVQAAIEAGRLSPSAMEDDSYVSAVDEQLYNLTNS